MKCYMRQVCAGVCLFTLAAFARADLIVAKSLEQQGGIIGGKLRFVLEFTTDNSWGVDPVTPLFDQ
jgi:hypothetical protein